MQGAETVVSAETRGQLVDMRSRLVGNLIPFNARPSAFSPFDVLAGGPGGKRAVGARSAGPRR